MKCKIQLPYNCKEMNYTKLQKATESILLSQLPYNCKYRKIQKATTAIQKSTESTESQSTRMNQRKEYSIQLPYNCKKIEYSIQLPYINEWQENRI